uniref:Uncharacterized protein n=1 Tax=Arundo donax TaxID=35708 RepID=A0A0A9FB58_ARUDO
MLPVFLHLLLIQLMMHISATELLPPSLA